MLLKTVLAGLIFSRFSFKAGLKFGFWDLGTAGHPVKSTVIWSPCNITSF